MDNFEQLDREAVEDLLIPISKLKLEGEQGMGAHCFLSVVLAMNYCQRCSLMSISGTLCLRLKFVLQMIG